MHTVPVRPFAILKLAILTVLALALLLLSGCKKWKGVRGNGDITSEQRQIAEFDLLHANGAFQVTWSTGAPSLTITADENLLRYIRTEVRNGRLMLDWDRPLRSRHGIKVRVTSATLRKAELNGAVKLTAQNISGPEFYLEANGATRVTLSGSTNAISAEMNGASRLDAEALQTRAAELEINGAGRANVNASNVLRVAVAGAGRVTYSGNPTISKSISGAGSVRRRE